jgi:hypothetical protein
MQPVFGTDKHTGLGYCKGHQYLRTDLDRRTPFQKALANKSVATKAHKELRFPNKKIQYTPCPEDGYDAPKQIILNDEFPIFGRMDAKEIDMYQKEEMDLFWKQASVVISKKPYCWECNDFIPKQYYRAATAHIYPKSIFESVMSNEWNYLVLGAGCGCHNKSHRLDTFSQMKVFPVAVQRYLKFGHLITEKHKYHDLFIEYANTIL